MKISKASFNSSGATANADVNVDDPNFWAKVMPNMKDAGLLKDELTALLAQLADQTAAANAAAAEAESGEAGSSSSAAAATGGVVGPDPAVVKKLVADIQEVAQEALDRLAAGKRLADVERRDVVDLLLRMSVSGELVGEKARASAEGLLDAFEGKRRRNAPGASSSSSGGPGKLHARIVGNSGKDNARTHGRSRGRGAANKGDDYELGGSEDDDDDDEELDEEEPDEEAEVGAGSGSDGEGRRKRGRPKGSLN